MNRKLIILKNSDSILDEDLENNFRNYDGKIEILNNFKTNIHVLFNQENYMNKLFNFEFIEMNTYLQISDRLLVNDSLIDKLNSDYSINYKSDELNIIKKSTKFNSKFSTVCTVSRNFLNLHDDDMIDVLDSNTTYSCTLYL